MNKKIFLITFLLLLGSISSFAKKDVLQRRGSNSFENVISFENKKDISYWTVVSGGKLEISKKHFKNGDKSLKWNFSANQKLVTSHPDIIKASASKNGGMKAWIYNEKSIDGYLIIKIGNKKSLAQGKAPYKFGFRLSFTGWHAFWVHFREDAKNGNIVPNENDVIDLVEITAPAKSGELFLDNVEFPDSVSWTRSEDHFKIINNEIDRFGLGHPWEYSNFWSKQSVPSSAKFNWNNSVASAFSKIEIRYKKWVLGDNPDFAYAPMKIRKKSLDTLIAEAKVKFADFNIKRHKDGTLTGKPLYSIREGHRPYFADLSMSVLLQLALDYKVNGNEQSLKKCLLALDFMNDQGWACGSSVGTIDHELLRHAGYFHTIYLLKDELKSTGRLDREIKTAKWFLNWRDIYHMPDYVGCTADFMRSVFMYRLLIVLSEDNGSGKFRDMTFYSKWINSSMRIASGFSDTFKPDFTGYHHRGTYMNAYSPGAFHMASVISYLLHGTSFEVKAEQIENLRQALITARIMNCKYSIPLGVCARFPEHTSNFTDILPAMAYLLKINPTDKELLGYYKSWWAPESELFKNQLFKIADSRLTFYHTLGAIQIMKKVSDFEGKTAKNISGNWFKPYAGLGIHRRDNWMVSAKGWSSYIWDFESGTGENVFGRYEGWGAIQFFTAGNPVSDRKSGYMPDKGWDWSRIPGTTSIKLPLSKMEHNKKGISSVYKEGKHRNFTDQTFLGGVSSKSGNGIFANKIHDTAFNPDFWARKSDFFFGNLVVCLGDDIRNSDFKNKTETTVFQLFDNGSGLKANNKKVERGEFETTERTIFEAPDNNTYIIPAGQNVVYHLKKQESMSESGKIATEGDYYTAWLNHGKAPKNADYEYAVIVDAKNAGLNPDNLEYKIVRKDRSAHIVKYGKETAYVIWDEELQLNKGILSSVSTPGLALLTEKGKNLVGLAFSDPDLRRPKVLNISGLEHNDIKAASCRQIVRILLNGKYKVRNPKDIKLLGYFNSKTILEVSCVNGETYQAILMKVE